MLVLTGPVLLQLSLYLELAPPPRRRALVDDVDDDDDEDDDEDDGDDEDVPVRTIFTNRARVAHKGKQTGTEMLTVRWWRLVNALEERINASEN